MALAVLKFGGTSIATEKSRELVYEKINQYKQKYDDLVVVVSAQGRKGDPYATDTLISLINTNDSYETKENRREVDMIYSCGEVITAAIVSSNLQRRNIQAVSLTGWQAGIMTDEQHFDSDVISVRPKTIKKHLKENKVVVIAGSQGLSKEGDITTLGRGGSDTTAVVLGSTLKADEVVIYTDVEGVMTADPKIVEDASIIHAIDFELCYHYAQNGAKVIHHKAILEAQKRKCQNLWIRSTFSNSKGTQILMRKQNAFGLSFDSYNNEIVLVYRAKVKKIAQEMNQLLEGLCHDVKVEKKGLLVKFPLKDQEGHEVMREIHKKICEKYRSYLKDNQSQDLFQNVCAK